ncbi:MAG TPA: hypothetical protein VGH44_02180 [Candidatus Saccharimonadia bacterium]
MRTRGEILRTHYLGLMCKGARWAALSALLATVLVPMGASATGQLTARSATVTNSAGGASTPYSIGFTLSGSQTLGSVKFEMCDSPLSTTACSASSTAGQASNGASFGSATFASMSLGSSWSIGSQTGASTSGTNLCLTHTAASLSGAATAVLNGVVNPAGTNQQYYLRISTYTDTACSTPAYPGADFGAVALDTTQALTVSANVQESLTFCTGTTSAPADCSGETGSQVKIGTGADNVLSSSAPSGAISTMVAATNATSGYSITYLAANLTSSSDTIGAVGSTPTAFPGAGTAAFGINLRANTSPSVTNSADKTGSGSGTVAANYNTVNQFAFVPSTATQVASASAPTQANVYTVSYAAQAGNTTKPGAFSTTFTYVCTGTF